MDYPYEGPDAEPHPTLVDLAGAAGIWTVLLGAIVAVIKFVL